MITDNAYQTINQAEILAQRGTQSPFRSTGTRTTQASTGATIPEAMSRRRRANAVVETYLSIPEVAERLGTSERFPRRLIEERRIEYKKFGSHVRIAASVLEAYIESCTVAPVHRVCRATGRRVR